MDTLKQYREDIGQNETLSRDEEQSIARLVVSGDRVARQELIKRNLPFVIFRAKIYQGLGVPLEDLIGYGNIGLIEAVDTFDPEVGVPFAGYAQFHIKNQILLGIGLSKNVVIIPRYISDIMIKWGKQKKILRARLGREATDDEISDSLSLGESKKELVLLALSHGQVGGERDVKVVHEKSEDTEEALRRLDEMRDERKRDILTRFFGLGVEQQSAPEIAEHLGISKQRVLIIKDEALRELRRQIG